METPTAVGRGHESGTAVGQETLAAVDQGYEKELYYE
jgi:hypothetical protein